MSSKKIAEPNLENNLTELKRIITQMEQKNISLDESLAQFERGIQLIRSSQALLSDAEQKIAILLNKNTLEPFEETNE